MGRISRAAKNGGQKGTPNIQLIIADRTTLHSCGTDCPDSPTREGIELPLRVAGRRCKIY